MTHLTNDLVAAFLGGAMNPGELEEIELHLDGCEECRQLVSLVVRQRGATGARATATTDVVPTGITLPAAVGEVLDGRYRLDRVLGVGGMGCVYEAHQLLLNQRVALKLMLPALASDQAAVGRFLREARAAARLNNAHVCRVLDLGTLPSGTPFLAMEFLQGESLEHRLAREGALPEALFFKLLLPVLSALEEAHALGITHRDIKPGNLFLTQLPTGEETLKILDFGIAKSIHPDIEAGLESTSAKTVMGSPQYMAPEQLVPGNAVDARTDIWALGCVIYETLCNRRPFVEENLVDLMYAIQRKPFTPVRSINPAVSSKAEAVVNRCLTKSPELRFKTIGELREALLRPEAAVVSAVRTPVRQSGAGPDRRLVAALAGVAALLVIIAIAVVATEKKKLPPPAPRDPVPTVAIDVAPVDAGTSVGPEPTPAGDTDLVPIVSAPVKKNTTVPAVVPQGVRPKPKPKDLLDERR